MEVIPKYNRHSMPWTLLVKPRGLQPQAPYTQRALLESSLERTALARALARARARECPYTLFNRF